MYTEHAVIQLASKNTAQTDRIDFMFPRIVAGKKKTPPQDRNGLPTRLSLNGRECLCRATIPLSTRYRIPPPPGPPISAPVPGAPSAPPIRAPPPAPIAAPANVSVARGLPKHPVVVITANALTNAITEVRAIIAVRAVLAAVTLAPCFEFIFKPRRCTHDKVRTMRPFGCIDEASNRSELNYIDANSFQMTCIFFR